MGNLLLPDMEALKIKFDGESHQIEANTFINSLLHFTTIVQELNRGLGATERKVEIKINALERGSFMVDLLIHVSDIAGAAGTLFSVNALPAIADLIKSVGALYNLAKFSKGEPTSVIETLNDSVKIENTTGDITYIDNRVYHIYNTNSVVNDAITQEFKTLENDESVSGFELLNTNNEKLFEAKREDFPKLAYKTTHQILPETKTVTKTGMLNIVSLSFEKNKKWNFIFEGNPIAVKLTDDEFVELIDKGESFAKGDSLQAELEITQEFNKAVNTYLNKSYKIVKILKHIPRPKQTSILPMTDKAKKKK